MNKLLLWLALWTTSLSVYSQDSLFHYLELAAKNNPAVLQKYNEYQTALQKIPQVGSLPDPEFSLGIFLSPMELVSGKQVADMRLMQMFPWFGVLKNAKDEMSLMAQARYESFRDAKAGVFYDLQRSWFELLKIRENIRLTEKNLDIMHSLERLAINKYKGGATALPSNSSPTLQSDQSLQASGSGLVANSMGNPGTSNKASMGVQAGSPMENNSMGASSGTGLADIYKLQIEIAELENNLASLQDQKTTAVSRLNTLIGRAVNAPIIVTDSLQKDTSLIINSALSDSILQNNPMLTMLQYEQQSLAARKKMVTRMGYPMVGLGVNYSLIQKNEMSTSGMNGKDMVMPMIVVTLPVYRKKYKAMQLETSFQQEASEQGYESASRSLLLEFTEAKNLFQDADRRIKLYANQSFLLDKTLAIATRSFSVSGNGLNDILQLHQQKLNYAMKTAESVADYNTSLAWLKRLMASSQTDVIEKRKNEISNK